MFFKKKVFKFKKGDTAISCEGFTPEEIITFINLVNGAEAAKEPELDEEALKKIVESKGDLHEFVDIGEDKKDIEIIDTERDFKIKKLPNCTSNFTCPHCRQSILLNNDNRVLVRDYRNHKLYDIGNIKLPDMKDNSDVIISVYDDCLNLIDRAKDFVLVSGSKEACSCPVCGHEGTVGEFINYHEMNYNDGETCDICGCEKDNVITQSEQGGTQASFDCVNHCIEKLKKL